MYFLSFEIFKRPERDSSQHFNLTQLIIVWIEFIVICISLFLLLSLFLGYVIALLDSNEKSSIGPVSGIAMWIQRGAGFSTFTAIQFFNPSNFLAAASSISRKATKAQRYYRDYGKTLPRPIKECFLCMTHLFNIDSCIGKIFLSLLAVCFFGFSFILATMSFAVKTGELSFVGHESATTWDGNQWISFFGFFYQISNISNQAPVRLGAMMNFVFWSEDCSYNSKDIDREGLFEQWIALDLLITYGWIKGFMYLYMTMDAKDIYKLSVKSIDRP